MKRFWIFALVLLGWTANAQPVPPVTQFTLPNGLTVVIKPDRRAPTAET